MRGKEAASPATGLKSMKTYGSCFRPLDCAECRSESEAEI